MKIAPAHVISGQPYGQEWGMSIEATMSLMVNDGLAIQIPDSPLAVVAPIAAKFSAAAK
jgi:hypothetical protein